MTNDPKLAKLFTDDKIKQDMRVEELDRLTAEAIEEGNEQELAQMQLGIVVKIIFRDANLEQLQKIDVAAKIYAARATIGMLKDIGEVPEAKRELFMLRLTLKVIESLEAAQDAFKDWIKNQGKPNAKPTE